MKKKRLPMVLLPVAVFASEVVAQPAPGKADDQTTAGAAIGHCLSKHPYQPNAVGQYNVEGFELPGPVALVGAVRRSYIYRRDERTDTAVADYCCCQLVPAGSP